MGDKDTDKSGGQAAGTGQTAPQPQDSSQGGQAPSGTPPPKPETSDDSRDLMDGVGRWGP